MRASKSLRTGRPKMASARSMLPAALPSSFLTSSFIALFLVLSRRSGRFGRRRLGCLPQTGRERQILRLLALNRVAHQYVAAVVTGDRAAHHDQPLIAVGRHDLEVQSGDALGAHVAGHLLVRKGAAGILTVAGRT